MSNIGDVTLYGQEYDTATAALAQMNMILHDNPTAQIMQSNTLSDPKFMEDGSLKTFDYVAKYQPFSDKRQCLQRGDKYGERFSAWCRARKTFVCLYVAYHPLAEIKW